MYKKNNLYRNLYARCTIPKYETNFANLLNGKYKKIAKKSDIINLNRLGILEIIILIMLINLDISL